MYVLTNTLFFIAFYCLDHRGGNIAIAMIARLRLGLSHLAEHLYTYNLIESPINFVKPVS